jgi:hypothetical protein
VLWWRRKPKPVYYINWDAVKTVEDMKALIMALPGAQGRIYPETADAIRRIKPDLVREVSD